MAGDSITTADLSGGWTAVRDLDGEIKAYRWDGERVLVKTICHEDMIEADDDTGQGGVS